MKLKSVIMAGGSGKRLWPLSSDELPKQFMKINSEYSSFQETLLRNQMFGKPFVVINDDSIKLAKLQIAELGLEVDLIIEQVRKDTGPCALAVSLIAKMHDFDNLVLIPADHIITKVKAYEAALQGAIDNISICQISMIGIKPCHPSSNYGYIQAKTHVKDNLYIANCFIEKPSIVKAKDYMRDDDFLWNSGIYVLNCQFVIDQFEQNQPDIYKYVVKAVRKAKQFDDYTILDKNLYSKVESISFDYAIVEKINKITVIKANFGWDDSGNWPALWSISHKDHNANYLSGNVIANEVSNSYIRSHNKQTIVIGLDDIIVVETDKGLLIAHKSKVNDLKAIEANLTYK